MKSWQAIIRAWTDIHYSLAVALYLLVFIVTIAATIPSATFLSLLAGFLFGTIGILYAMTGITFGGLVLFYAVRTAIGEPIRCKASGWIKQVEEGFQQNAFYYILTFRLFPIFPCWISNIASGALNVPVKTFILATVIGVAPATIIYVMAGRGMEKLLATHQSISVATLLTPSLLLPLLALAIFSLFPVFYKSIKKNHR